MTDYINLHSNIQHIFSQDTIIMYYSDDDENTTIILHRSMRSELIYTAHNVPQYILLYIIYTG